VRSLCISVWGEMNGKRGGGHRTLHLLSAFLENPTLTQDRRGHGETKGNGGPDHGIGIRRAHIIECLLKESDLLWVDRAEALGQGAAAGPARERCEFLLDGSDANGGWLFCREVRPRPAIWGGYPYLGDDKG
jgi:hypothetical protein